MPHTAYVAHHISGRIRLRVPAARSNPALLEQIGAVAKAIPGVEGIESNATTGSVLIHYAQDECQDFEASLAGAGDSIFELLSIRQGQKAGSRRSETDSTTAIAIAAAFKSFDTRIKTVTDNTLDLKVLLPMAAAAAAAFTAREALATPLWLTLAIFAFSAFVVLHPGIEVSQSGGADPAVSG